MEDIKLTINGTDYELLSGSIGMHENSVCINNKWYTKMATPNRPKEKDIPKGWVIIAFNYFGKIVHLINWREFRYSEPYYSNSSRLSSLSWLQREKATIHSVKRLDNSEILSVDDITNHGRIESFWIGTSNTMFATMEGRRHTDITTLIKVKPKVYWEILSVCSKDGNCWSCDKVLFDWYLKNSDYNIHQVKRLSDGEVFAVGDNLVHKTDGYINTTKILKFVVPQAMSHLMWFEFVEGKNFVKDLANFNKVKPKVPLFQTPTNESIYEGEEFYYMPKGTLHWINKSVKGLPQPPESFYYFKTKEDAIQFQLLNKPIEISAKDIIDYVTFHEGAFLHEKIINLFKTKINP